MTWVKPITLLGKHITLVPLAVEHCKDLIEATCDGELWKLRYATVPSPDEMLSEIKQRLDSPENKTLLPLAVIDNVTRCAIGMTTYLNISEINRRLDIGWTWYRKSSQKTSVNTECKLLLLTYAFESLKCVAVGFGANQFNLNSRRAIERIGAKFEGITRNMRIMRNGTVCDFYKYSILDNEWETVKINLENKLMGMLH